VSKALVTEKAAAAVGMPLPAPPARRRNPPRNPSDRRCQPEASGRDQKPVRRCL